MRDTPSNPADARIVIGAALAASAIGALFYNVLPLYLGTAAESKRLTNEQIGLVGAAFFLGFNLAGLSAFAWVRKCHWRNATLAMIPIGLAALFFSVKTGAYSALLVATAIGGAAFGGLFCVAGVILGDTSKPARWYGVKTAVESVVGAALMIILSSQLVRTHDFNATVVGMAIVVAALAPALFFLPRAWRKSDSTQMTGSDSGAAPTRRRAGVICALLVVLVFFAGNSGIWAFAERMGASAGFDAGAVGTLLSVTLVCGVAGSLGVAVLGGRYGARVPFYVSAALVVAALFCLAPTGNFAAYAVGLCLYMVGWSAGVPLALAEVARLDFDGRFVALGAPAVGVGSMLGPATAGWLFQEGGSTFPMLAFAAFAMALAAAFIFAAERVSLGQILPIPFRSAGAP